MTIVAVTSKRGLVAACTILTIWIGILALYQEPETNPHWMSPILLILAASCVTAGTRITNEASTKQSQEPMMVLAGIAMSAFFVRLMHLVGINHILDLTKDSASNFSLGLLNLIWIGFFIRDRRPANLILAWMSFVIATFSVVTMQYNNQPIWLSPVILFIPILTLGFLYTMTPRNEANEGAFTALCVVPGWVLSTLFLRQESMRPWVGLNTVASYTVAWVVFAVFLITVGFKTERRFLRYWALTVFAITVGKVFVVDLSELDSVIRVAMLILLSAGMMGGGYWYILWRRSHGVQPEPLKPVEDSVQE